MTITSFLIVLLLKWLGLFPLVDEKIFDLFARARHSTGIRSIISVRIENERMPALPGLLKYLEKADAAAIGIDSRLLRDGFKFERDGKILLRPGLRKKIVVTCEISRKDETDPSFQVAPSLPRIQRDILKEGFISIVPDSDNIVRSTLIRVPVKNGTLPSFAFQLYRLYLEQKGKDQSLEERGGSLRIGGQMIPLEQGRDRWGDLVKINYTGAEHFRPMSCGELKNLPSESYKDYIILLMAPETSTLFDTPVGSMSAMLIEAEALNTLIEGTTWKRVSKPFSLGILFFICLLSVGVVLRIRKISTSASIIAGAVVLYFITSFILFIEYSILVEIFMPFIAASVSLASAVYYRMNTAEKMLETRSGNVTGEVGYSVLETPSTQRGSAKTGTPVPDEDRSDSNEQTPGHLPAHPISIADFRTGEIIGKYKILDRIGSGGMGEVFLVLHLNLKVKRAIKVIKPEILTKTGMRERFRIEAEAVARLNNPHIITVHDYEEINGIPCIEMEYFESRNLRSEMKRGIPLRAQRVLQIMDNITCGLEAAHKASPVPMIHRDLKPENVLVSSGDPSLLKIIDFGLVKVLSDDLEHTVTSVPLGTPYYMSPEQIKAEATGPATDIYALGVILFEMVTGRKPFEKDTYMEILNQHLQSPVPSAHAMNASYPEKIDGVISRAMEKDPLCRFGDAREFYRELRGVIGDREEPPLDDPLAKTL